MKTRPELLLPGLVVLTMPGQALAYVGPGVGLGAIMATLAVVLGVMLLVVGFLWYPLKRVLRRDKSAADAISSPHD